MRSLILKSLFLLALSLALTSASENEPKPGRASEYRGENRGEYRRSDSEREERPHPIRHRNRDSPPPSSSLQKQAREPNALRAAASSANAKKPSTANEKSSLKMLRSGYGGYSNDYDYKYDAYDVRKYGNDNYKERFASFEPKKYEGYDKHGYDKPKRDYDKPRNYEHERPYHRNYDRSDYRDDGRPPRYDRDYYRGEYGRDYDHRGDYHYYGRPRRFDYDRDFYPPRHNHLEYDLDPFYRSRDEFLDRDPYLRGARFPDFPLHHGYGDLDLRYPSLESSYRTPAQRNHELELLADLERLKVKSNELDRVLEKLAKEFLEIFGLKDAEKLSLIKQLIEKQNANQKQQDTMLATLLGKISYPKEQITSSSSSGQDFKVKTLLETLTAAAGTP